jgi:uncharacterized protein YndB with AHSA1/START domain
VPHAEHVVIIQRPVEAVFAYLSDGEKCPEWRPVVLDIHRLSGEGVGAKYTQGVQGPMGRRVAADYETTVFEPNRRIEFQTTAGPVRPHGTYGFEDVDGATRLTFALRVEVAGLRKLLMGSMVQRTMDQEVRALDNVKRILEG